MPKQKVYAILTTETSFILGYKAPYNGKDGLQQYIGGCPEPLGGTVKKGYDALYTLKAEIAEESGGLLTYDGELPDPYFSGQVFQNTYDFYELNKTENENAGINPAYGDRDVFARDYHEMLGTIELQFEDFEAAENEYTLSWMIIEKMYTSLIHRHFTDNTAFPAEANAAQFIEYFGHHEAPSSLTLQAIAKLVKSKFL